MTPGGDGPCWCGIQGGRLGRLKHLAKRGLRPPQTSAFFSGDIAILRWRSKLLRAEYRHAHNAYRHFAIEQNRVEGPEGPAYRHGSSAAWGRDGPAKGRGEGGRC